MATIDPDHIERPEIHAAAEGVQMTNEQAQKIAAIAVKNIKAAQDFEEAIQERRYAEGAADYRRKILAIKKYCRALGALSDLELQLMDAVEGL